MKILLISPEDLQGSTWGGVSTYTTLLADNLGKLGQDVSMLTPGSENEFHRKRTYNSVKIRLRKTNKRNHITRKVRKVLSILFPQFTKRISWGLAVLRFVRKQGPFDIIEAPEWGNSTLFVSIFTKQKTIVKLHRGWYCYYKDNSLPISPDIFLSCILEFASIIFASAISSPTKYMLSYYRYLLFFHQLKRKKSISVIPYGIELGTKSKSGKNTKKNQRNILFVGRVEIAKGVFVLVQAFKKVVRKWKNVKLMIIGEDMHMCVDNQLTSYTNYIQTYIHQNNLTKNIRIIGKLPREELKTYYDDCLFLVVPSVGNENFPFVILEAMSSNKTAIISNAGGLPEMIQDNKNGLLCKQNSSASLARKISYLIENNTARKKFESYNTKYKKEFDIHNIALQTLLFYKSI